jgi:glycosyltransferase involved in cell wall biosynthesis
VFAPRLIFGIDKEPVGGSFWLAWLRTRRVLYRLVMRVCLVSRIVPVHAFGGMQDHAVDLVSGLASAGHDVEVITGRHPEGHEEEVTCGVRWHYVDAPTDDFSNRLWRERSYEQFVRASATQPFDVIHGEGSSALELARRGVHRRTPLVVMFHGNFLGIVKASVRRQVRRPTSLLREQYGLLLLARRHVAKGNWRVFRGCEAMVLTRQQLVDTCRSHCLDPERVHVVPSGVDTSVFRPRPRAEARAALGLPDGFLFICAGRLESGKGTHHALNALALMGEPAQHARLLVVGDGAERAALERLARELGVTERVIFAGAQTPERMPAYIAAADVLLFPTELNEALPLILLQGMACALPVIASRTGAIPDVIGRPGYSGLLVPPGDARALAATATTVYRDKGLRRRLGGAARHRVLTEYTMERMTERTLAVYELARDRLRHSTRD